MNIYFVTGTIRKVGAIGLHLGFGIRVEAESREQAREVVRAHYYKNDYEHVHIVKVAPSEGIPSLRQGEV